MSLHAIRLLILSFCLTLPLGVHFFIHPIIKKDIIRDMERESVHLARHTMTLFNLENTVVDSGVFFAPEVMKNVTQTLKTFGAEKIRLFTPQGIIVFSTDQAETGRAHANEHFAALVKEKKIRSVKVAKDHTTFDGAVSQKTVIETYVPILAQGEKETGSRLLAVQEIYFDISERWGEISGLLNNSLFIVSVIAFFFFLTSHVIIKRLEQNENALTRANRDLTAKNHDLVAMRAKRDTVAAYLQNIIDQIEDHVLVIDPEYRVTWMNRAAKKAYHEASGHSRCHEITHQLDSPCGDKDYPCPLEMAREKGTPFSVLHTHTDRNGNERHIEIHASPIMDEKGSFGGIIQFARDRTVTINREKEEAKRQHLQSLGFIAAGIAHDFNNLLMTILGNINLAENLLAHGHSKPDEITRSLREAAKSSKQAAVLTKKLLTFASGGEPVLRQVDMQAYMIESGLLPLKKFAAVTADCTFAHDLRHVSADPDQLDQVMHNLLINSAEAMDFKGTITITVENHTIPPNDTAQAAPGDYVKITLADTGRGIDPSHIQHVFDPYFSTKQMASIKGTGLGLAISHSIVQRHGGEISVVSQPGKGATFTILLPAAPPATP